MNPLRMLAERLATAIDLPIEQVEHLVKPSIALTLRSGDDRDTMTGASRSDGHPDLPVDYTWPCNGQRPLAHYVQLNLADLPQLEELDLPRSGLLSFFYDADAVTEGHTQDDTGNAHVAWFPKMSQLQGRNPPENLAPRYQWIPMGFDIQSILSIPDGDVLQYEGIDLGNEGANLYYDLRTDEGADEDDDPIGFQTHRVGGWWSHGQNDARVEAEAASQSATDEEFFERCRQLAGQPDEFSDWLLLLQLQSFTDPAGDHVNFADDDHICFMIRKSDLAARDFSRVRAAWVY